MLIKPNWFEQSTYNLFSGKFKIKYIFNKLKGEVLKCLGTFF
jgi:hypothetical protein